MTTKPNTQADEGLRELLNKVDRIETHGFPDSNGDYFEDAVYRLLDRVIRQKPNELCACGNRKLPESDFCKDCI